MGKIAMLAAALALLTLASAASAQTATGQADGSAAATTSGAPDAGGSNAAQKGAGNTPDQVPNLLKNGMGNAQSPALPAGQQTGNARSTTNN